MPAASIEYDGYTVAELCNRISQLEHALRSVLHDPLHQETAANATRILEDAPTGKPAT